MALQKRKAIKTAESCPTHQTFKGSNEDRLIYGKDEKTRSYIHEQQYCPLKSSAGHFLFGMGLLVFPETEQRHLLKGEWLEEKMVYGWTHLVNRMPNSPSTSKETSEPTSGPSQT